MASNSHNESNATFLEFLSRRKTDDLDKMNIVDQQGKHESVRNGQKFLEMYNQIREFLTLVKAFVKHMYSNKTNPERNILSIVTRIHLTKLPPRRTMILTW